MDKLPLPAVISFIRAKVREGEVIRIGNKMFSKVFCIGQVVSCRPLRTLASTEYTIADLSEDASALKEISVLHREESFSTESDHVPFLTGSVVFIYGKLIRLKGVVAIQAICMRKVIHSDEYECLKMEAFLALQYHVKNPSGQTPVRCGQVSSLRASHFTPPSSSPAAGKRLTSATDSLAPTPKRPSFSRCSAPRNMMQGADTKNTIGTRQNNSGDMKETDSQDSFEDSVCFEK
ncbi:hypothetical protein RB195_006257 [Necator americanus]